MINIDKLRTEVFNYLDEKDESQNAFAKRLGIEQSSMSKFLSCKTGIAFDSGMKIMKELGYVLARAGDKNVTDRLLEKIDSLTRERDALLSANKALELNVEFLSKRNIPLDAPKEMPQSRRTSQDKGEPMPIKKELQAEHEHSPGSV